MTTAPAAPAERQLHEPADTARATTNSATVRVLHVINGEHYAGAERVQDLLAQRLPELGFAVSFACVKPDQFPCLRRARQAPLYEAPMRGKLDLRPAAALARLIRRGGYRLIHTHTARTALVGRVAAALSGARMVHHVHSPAAADTTHPWRNRINAATERISLTRVAGLITVSESLRKYVLRAGIPGRLVSVVPNGVPARGPLAQRPRPVGPWTLGTVALFRPRKGLEVLLDALAILKCQGLPARLRAVGCFETPDYEAQIKARVSRLDLDDEVQWRGFQKDVGAELSQMDLFVLPSLFGEGLPMVILEAMAAGVPVVGTRIEGVPEAIRHGVDGLLAEPGDASDLAAAVGRVIRGQVDWSQLRTSAHQRQADRFSDGSMAAGVAQVYRRVLAC